MNYLTALIHKLFTKHKIEPCHRYKKDSHISEKVWICTECGKGDYAWEYKLLAKERERRFYEEQK